MEINTDNILRAIELMKTIPEERINMRIYRGRNDPLFGHECQSTGCVIGFSTALDTPDNLKQYITGIGGFNYKAWSMSFFSLKGEGELWNFMFGSKWPNDKEQIIKRLQWIADGKQPPQSFDPNTSKDFNYEIFLP